MRRGVSSLLVLTLILSVTAWGCRSSVATKPELGKIGGVRSRPAARKPGASASQGVITCSEFASALRTGTYPFRTLIQSSSSIYPRSDNQSIRYLAVQPGTSSAITRSATERNSTR